MARLLPVNNDMLLEKKDQRHDHHFDYMRSDCLEDIASLVEDPDSVFWRKKNSSNEPYYTLIIVVLGPWEVMQRYECGAGLYGRTNQTKRIFQGLFAAENPSESIHKDNSNSNSNAPGNTTGIRNSGTRFVWRTWGTHGGRDPANTKLGWENAKAHNQLVKQLVDTQQKQRHQTQQQPSFVSYIDWAHVMRPRMFPKDRRLKGDIDAHYALEARLTFCQMLINHLVEQDRQARHHLPPWQPSLEDRDSDDYNVNTTLANKFLLADPQPVKTFEEEKTFGNAKASFCPDCMFSKDVTCRSRFNYMRVHYGTTELDALLHTMKTPNCNSTASTK